MPIVPLANGTDRILPHELSEENELYPAMARPLGSGEATATMSRTHAEIKRLADRIGTHVRLAESVGAIEPDQVDDLLACLHGLFTLMRVSGSAIRQTRPLSLATPVTSQGAVSGHDAISPLPRRPPGRGGR